MIQINLLPPERRRTERTPIGRFILILLGVTLVCVTIAFLVYLEIQLHGRKQLHADRKKEFDRPYTTRVNLEHAALTALDATHKSRKAVIEQLRPPFRWSNVLDILCDMLETKHKKIWFETIRTLKSNDLRTRQQKLGVKTPLAGGMIVEGQSAGLDPAPYLKFRSAVIQGKDPKAVEKLPGTSDKPPAKADKPAGGNAPAGEKPPAGPEAPGTTPPATVGKPPAAGAASQEAPALAKRRGKILIDYFTGGILKVVEFSAKDQSDYEEQFSQSFTIEFYVKKAAGKK
jgi:hypothetical protein